MSSKKRSDVFIESMSLWIEKTYKRIKRSTHLADWEKSNALDELHKYGLKLQSHVRILESSSNMRLETYEYLLDDLLATQKESNRIAAFYELPLYSPVEKVTDDRGVELRTTNRYMAPFLEPNDKILCLPIDRNKFFDFRGLGVLVCRRGRTIPRDWWVGRIEPIQKRLIRLNFDNKAYGHLDRAVPLSEVIMLYKVVEVNRAIL